MSRQDLKHHNHKNTNQPNAAWLNKTNMALSLGISTQAFDKWKVKPVAKIGRETFFTVRSVVENRVDNAMRQAKSLRKSEVV